MKLFCKCGVQLTKDVCKTTKDNIVFEYYGDDDEDYNVKFGEGFFRELKKVPKENNKWHEDKPAQIWKGLPKSIRVAEGDVVISIPEMPSGYGCCNWSFGADLYCSCGNAVGMMYMDCYEDGYVDFIEKNIARRY